MKIEYEPGDIVEVEDNTEAGEFAGRHVELIHQTVPARGTVYKRWLAKSCDTGKQAFVEERFLHP